MKESALPGLGVELKEHALWAFPALLAVALLLAQGVGLVHLSLWSFPAILMAAFLVAWATEASQFYISQGVAFAILAFVQTLPEYAVEAVIAWSQDVNLMMANFTGAIRLLVGLGWPMVYAVAAFFHWRNTGEFLREVRLEREHSVEVLAMVPPTLYFLVILLKGAMTVWDVIPLVLLYGLYIRWALRIPPLAEERMEDLPGIPRRVVFLPARRRRLALLGLYGGGGALIYLAAHPFVESMKEVALAVGVSQFVFVQWVAPFLSEFPEKVSAFYWAKQVKKAPMGIVNMLSSVINEWTLLAGLIPVVYSLSAGEIRFVPLDPLHRTEVLMTVAQSALGFFLLADLRCRWHESAIVFFLWAVQFFWPEVREEIVWVYIALIALAVLRSTVQGLPVLSTFLALRREQAR